MFTNEKKNLICLAVHSSESSNIEIKEIESSHFLFSIRMKTSKRVSVNKVYLTVTIWNYKKSRCHSIANTIVANVIIGGRKSIVLVCSYQDAILVICTVIHIKKQFIFKEWMHFDQAQTISSNHSEQPNKGPRLLIKLDSI